MPIRGVFQKQPTEDFEVDIDYTDQLPGVATVASGILGAIDLSDDSDASGTVLSSTTAVITDSVKTVARVIAGTDARDYKITFTSTLSTGRVFVDELIMMVRDT